MYELNLILLIYESNKLWVIDIGIQSKSIWRPKLILNAILHAFAFKSNIARKCGLNSTKYKT